MSESSNIRSFQVTLTAAGTSQAVEAPTKGGAQVSSAVIRALSANTGIIYVGNDGTDKVSSTTGFELAAGEALSVDMLGLGKWFFNGTKTGDKICVIATGP